MENMRRRRGPSCSGLTLAVSRRRKRRRSAAEPKLEPVGSSAWLGLAVVPVPREGLLCPCLRVPPPGPLSPVALPTTPPTTDTTRADLGRLAFLRHRDGSHPLSVASGQRTPSLGGHL